MKRVILFTYFILSITTISAWLIWSTARNACDGFFNGGHAVICYPDDQTQLGIVLYGIFIGIVFTGVSLLVMKLLGFSLTRK